MGKPLNKRRIGKNVFEKKIDPKSSSVGAGRGAILRNVHTAEPSRVRNAWVMYNKQKILKKQEFEEREQKIAKNMKKLEQQYGKLKKESCYKYIICPGNNSDLIRRVMATRGPVWEEIPDNSKIYNFKWKPFSYGLRFEEISLYGHSQVVNHIFNHEEITTKDRLFLNLSEYCKEHKLDVFQYVPLTFILDYNSKKFLSDLSYLEKLFKIFQKEEINTENLQDLLSIKNEAYLKELGYNSQNLNMSYLTTHSEGKNLWFLKLTQLNRGRGIYVFDQMEKLITLLNDSNESVEGMMIVRTGGVRKKFKPSYEKVPTLSVNLGMKEGQKENIIYKSSVFVIQKYIEKPLLIHGRKFDIRVWVLYWNKRIYLFEEGYIRTACEQFSKHDSDINNQYIHLTNNAIQKNADNYGTYEEGNQLSFKQFYTYMKERDPRFDIQEIWTQMEESIKITFKSIEHNFMKKPKNHDKSCFEIFGYDFMIDQNFKTWLIECNTNPCIEESSELLQTLLPRMIDDALSLTIDKTFSSKGSNLKEMDHEARASPFRILEYKDTHNLWKPLLTLSI